MATRSTISVVNTDGTVSSIYCHWDGYISNNGRILTANYETLKKAQNLVKHGDLSSLAPEIGEKHDFDNPTEGWCVYYGRDRGEGGTDAIVYDNLGMYSLSKEFEEYNYLFYQGEWYLHSACDCYELTKIGGISMTKVSEVLQWAG